MSVQINGTNGLTFNDGSSQQTAWVPGMRNRIINGAMMIDQRNAGASVTPNFNYTVDRWYCVTSPTGKITAQQNAGSVTPPVGFTNYLGITSTSSYSVGSSDAIALAQLIEGFNAADLGWGTSNAQSVNLSFKVYSSLTGTFGGSLSNGAADRSYPFSYPIPVANTWTTISVAIAGDTTGTWLKTNGIGICVQFGLGVGSTLSGTTGAWAGANYLSATGATSVVGTNGATFYITGVQLEKGSTATSFDYRPYGTELALCQRYYQKSYDTETAVGTSTQIGLFTGTLGTFSTSEYCIVLLRASMRSAPSVSYYLQTGTLGTIDVFTASAGTTTTSISTGNSGNNSFRATIGRTGDTLTNFHWTASSEL